MTEDEIRKKYTERYEALKSAAQELKDDITKYLSDKQKFHIDRIDTRAKDIDSFVAKATKVIEDKQTKESKLKYENPLSQIQDQVGARILILYLDDVEELSKTIKNYYGIYEDVTKEPDNDYEFKYFGRHFILSFPTEIREKYGKDKIPVAFELQIKTLFQYAWSECEHDLNYKPHGKEIDKEGQRLLALASAQSWGSDRIFDELIKKTKLDS